MLKFFAHARCMALAGLLPLFSPLPAAAAVAASDVSCTGPSSLAKIGICDGEPIGEPSLSDKPALVLNGEGQFARSASMALDLNRDYTVSTNVNFTSLEDSQTMLSQDGVHVSGFYLQKTGDNHFALAVMPADDSDASNALARATSMTLAMPDRWYTVTGVKSGHILFIYVNGKYEGSALLQQSWNTRGPLIVGRAKFNEATDFIHGAIGRTAVWQRALSPTEIESLAASR